MKFGALKSFKETINAKTLQGVIQYLQEDLGKALRELSTGLSRLTLSENFESFTVQVSIPATSEIPIRNLLTGGVTPTKRVIVRSNSSTIVDGDTAWTSKYVYLKNTGGSTATATVIFLR